MTSFLKYMPGGAITIMGLIMMAGSYLEGMNDKTAVVFVVGGFIAAIGIPIWILTAAITYFISKKKSK